MTNQSPPMVWASAFELNRNFLQLAQSLKQSTLFAVNSTVDPDHRNHVTQVCNSVLRNLIALETDRITYVQPELDKHTVVSIVAADSYMEYLNTVNYLCSYVRKIEELTHALNKATEPLK